MTSNMEPESPDGTPEDESAVERAKSAPQYLSPEEIAEIEARKRPRARGPNPPADAQGA